MAEHTPGPWHYDPNADTIFGGASGKIRVAETDMGRIYEADAILISAAPDLLAACDAMVEWLGQWKRVPDGGLEIHCLPIVQAMEAAIARARGTAQEIPDAGPSAP